MPHVEFKERQRPPSLIFSNVLVDFKSVKCHMSNFENSHVMSAVFLLMSKSLMLHVNFEQRPCHPVKFKG